MSITYWLRVIDGEDENNEIFRSTDDQNVPTYEGQEMWLGSGSYHKVESIRLYPFHSKVPEVTLRIPSLEFKILSALSEWSRKPPKLDW